MMYCYKPEFDSKIIKKTRHSEALGLGFALKAVRISYS